MHAISRAIICLGFVCLAAKTQGQPVRPGIVPVPVEQTFGEGTFLYTTNTRVEIPDADLSDYFMMRAGVVSGVKDENNPGNTIRVVIDDRSGLPAEGYRLKVEPEAITVTGKDRNGAIYGIETVVQLLAPEYFDPQRRVPEIECQTITDYPRYRCRAMHLDVARTFSDKQTVLRYIDNMARHKLNTLHWHLTDDEGWRIEINSYPRLTEVGAFRGGDSPVKHVYGAWDERYGGYFIQDDIREVVAYAEFRGITIIPEIDLPGHSRAAAKAYPDILCGGTVDTTAAGDDRRNVWCASKESNFEMLDKIIGEIAALFPSEYIHVGGDEVDEAPWTNCPDCGPRVKAHSAHALNGEFMARVAEILTKHGKKQAVWNEAVNGGNLPKQALVYGWENVEVCRKSLQAGYKTVLMPSQYFYFDMRQAVGEPGMTWAGTVTLEKVYLFEPAKVGITAEEQKNVVGVEGAFWAEAFLSQSPEYLDFQTYPRICALAEVAWSPASRRNWPDFLKRMTLWHYRRLADYGIGFRLDPPRARRVGDRIVVSAPLEDAQVRYTTDGSVPDRNSPLATDVIFDPRSIYRFSAFHANAWSRPAYLEGWSETLLKPGYKLTSSIKQSASHPYSNASDYNAKTAARTLVTCRAGDWFVWTFDRPLNAGSVRIKTGANHMGRYVVPTARLEASYDGQTYETVEQRFHVETTFEPRPGLRSIRLVVESADNGEEYAIIHDLVITAPR